MKQFYPASNRNKQPILDKLRQHFSDNSHILEIASGTGQHANYFTSQMQNWIWQPSDSDPKAIISIDAYQQEAKRINFLEAATLSTQSKKWSVGTYNAAFCCNLIHIAPWETCIGLFHHLSIHLMPQGKLALYGPFFEEGMPTVPSNTAFDKTLRNQNTAWGIRKLSEVEKVANNYNFILIKQHQMPANNLLLVFQLK